MGIRSGRFLRSLCMTVLLSACTPLVDSNSLTEIQQPAIATPRSESVGWQNYGNDDYRFSLSYPPGWIREDESYQSVVLAPQTAASWQPDTPAELPQNPEVRVEAGEYIRERAGRASFPETIDPVGLRTWLEEQVDHGAGEQLTERVINDHLAFEVTEIGESGCLRTVYWRPNGVNDLVKLSTGCESPYLVEFDAIVNSIEQTR